MHFARELGLTFLAVKHTLRENIMSDATSGGQSNPEGFIRNHTVRKRLNDERDEREEMKQQSALRL